MLNDRLNHSLLGLSLFLTTGGCTDDTLPHSAAAPDGGSGAVLAIGTLISGDTESNAYLRLVDEVDVGGEEFSLDEAREFPGPADVAVRGGSVFVASGDEPSITKYQVTGGLELERLDADDRISFADYGIASAAFWNNQFVASDKAYMTNGAEELIVWNPERMEIETTIELPELATRKGLMVVPGLADRASAVHEGKYYLPLYWTDENYAKRSDDSVLVVVDVDSGTVETTIAVDCPGLDYATIDDDGMLHFSNWTGGVGTYYALGTAKNCIATLDPRTQALTTRTFASIADGHEGAAFRYAGGGRFVMSVFDEVRADAEGAEEPFGIVAGPNWQLWEFDAGTDVAAPIESVDWNSGAVIHVDIGDNFYSMVPGEGYSSTVVYKHRESGNVEAAFGITGWSFRLFQVR